MKTLPNITDLEGLEAFTKAAPAIRPKDNQVFKVYGEIDENIERAAIEVESYMLQRREQG
ncbi:MAG TPA: hypothetical protein EYG79_08000 [Rhodobacteraceae bacterium]|nr:hypothetical protein [Paracoccaceae bacterium]